MASRWTPKETALAAELYRALPAHAVAAKIGRSVSAVRLKMNRIGAAAESRFELGRPKNEKKRKVAVKLRVGGKTWREVGAALGISRQAAWLLGRGP